MQKKGLYVYFSALKWLKIVNWHKHIVIKRLEIKEYKFFRIPVLQLVTTDPYVKLSQSKRTAMLNKEGTIMWNVNFSTIM